MDDFTPIPALTLAVRPSAIEVFHDLARGKDFVTLHYRRESHSRRTALDLIPQVLDDLAQSALGLTETLRMTLSQKDASAKPRFTVSLEAAVAPLSPSGVPAPGASAFPAALRAHFAEGVEG